MPTKKCKACGAAVENRKAVYCEDCQDARDSRGEQDSDGEYETTSFDRMISGNTSASNPGNVKVDWMYCFGSWPMETGASVLFAIGLGVFAAISSHTKNPPIGLTIGIGVVVSVVAWFFYWFSWSRTMVYGCVNPGIVVDAEEGLVAVATNLDCGAGIPFHVIKIVKQPLHRIPDGLPQKGHRVATVASYSGDPKQGHWQTFSPCVVGCMNPDPKVSKRVLKSISNEDWEELLLGLKEVPKPYKKGQWQVLKASE
jgi:hypothetical protein